MRDQLRRSHELISAEQFEDDYAQALNHRDAILVELAHRILIDGDQKHRMASAEVCKYFEENDEIREALASDFMRVTGITTHLTQAVVLTSYAEPDDGDYDLDHSRRKDTSLSLASPTLNFN